MEKEMIQQINLEDIKPHPGNRRVGGFDEAKLLQLAESIKAVGVQQPAIVRAVNKHYQLVAGERRWRASKLAGKETLPCVVRELDDLTVLKIQTIENLQREDIHPLDEADGYARLIDQAGYGVELVAQELGKSISYVYQRLKLRDLIKEARTLFVEGKITAGHAILIARLEPEQQKEICEKGLRDWGGNLASVRELGDWIHENILMELSKVTWKLDDAELLPAAGSCLNCYKRSGYHPDLFADVCTNKKDYCTDRHCFAEKGEAMVSRRKEELKGTEYVEVCDGYMRKTPENALDYYQWTECKKKDQGAKRILVVAGRSPGRLTYGRISSYRGYERSPEEKAREKEERKKEKQLSQIADAIRRNVYVEVLHNLYKDLEKNKFPFEILKLIVLKVWDRWYYDSKAVLGRLEGWIDKRKSEIYEKGDEKIKEMDFDQLMVFLFKIIVCEEMDPRGPYQYSPQIRDKEVHGNLKEAALFYNIDIKQIKKEVKAGFNNKPKKPKKQEKVTFSGVCQVCGCTDDNCTQCIEKTGEPCHWVNEEHTLCSACSGDANA